MLYRLCIQCPLFVRTTLTMLLAVWAGLLAARGAMLYLVWNEVQNVERWDLAQALYIGAKFDVRMAVFAVIPLALITGIPWLARCLAGLRIWLVGLYTLLFTAATVVYVVDFGFFFYLHQRLDSTILDFLRDLDISATMVWQSYPVVWIGVGLIVVAVGYAALTNALVRRHLRVAEEQARSAADVLAAPSLSVAEALSVKQAMDIQGRIDGRLGWKRRTAWTFALFAALFLLGYGQMSSNLFPLRWSNAYFSVDRNLALLALNPIQNVRDTTVAVQAVRPDVNAVRAGYERMAKWLRVDAPDAEQLHFWRHSKGQAPAQGKPLNVVVILMESFSWPMTSFAPGSADPTPHLRELASQSLYFSNFYAPARTTARAIFTSVTGIPDVNRAGGTSSRNQLLVDQFLIFNEFKGYDKKYLIGGSASWANIRGIIAHNVDGLTLLEESDWAAPNVDVWGISDLSLFREAVKVFDKSPTPFAAFIQTAGFHRPYTIPDDNAGFEVRTPAPGVLENYGYSSPEEYNSLRFSDHALGEFFRLARQQPWFENTVFAIMGDHGLTNVSANMTPGYLACGLQDSHIPLLLYAPGLLKNGQFKPGVHDFPCGQPDVFPTLATLAGIPFRNHTLGRNLLDPRTAEDARQFITGASERSWRLVEDGYCYMKDATEALYDLSRKDLENLLTSDPQRAARMRDDAKAFYDTSKYLLFNNKKNAAPE